MGDLSKFEREQIVGACLAAASVTKTAALLGVLRATVSKVTSAYTKTSSAVRNSGQKSTLREIDHRTLRRTVLKNHSTAAQMTTDLNVHLEDPVSTRTVQHELHKSSIHGKAATAKPLITESNAQVHKWWCHDHTTRTSDNCKCLRDMIRRVVLHTVPYIRKHLCLENIQEILQSRMPGSNSETWGSFCNGLGSNIMVQYSVGPIITLHDGRITARGVCEQCPHSHSWNCSVVV
jgi:anion-transporting  ArsA/GET3 family ATPase